MGHARQRKTTSDQCPSAHQGPHDGEERAHNKPTLRPYFPIIKENGAAANNQASVCKDAGSVASVMVGASINPASPPKIINMGMELAKMASATSKQIKFPFRASEVTDMFEILSVGFTRTFIIQKCFV